MSRGLAATFLDDGEGRVFSLLRRPAVDSLRGCVLVVPPFAEEMNKSRRMVTELAGALIERGIALVLVDLFGTGDSDGDFTAADWERWKRDLGRAAAWGESQGCRVNGFLGIRLGCALGAEFARQLPGIEGTLFWQPVLDGTRMVEQFLRLRVAASMMSVERETAAELRARLARGEIVEVAGYGLSGKLVSQLDGVRLEEQIGRHLGKIVWAEVVRSAEALPPSPAVKAVEKARAAVGSIALETVVGEPFWSSVEITTSRKLLELSRDFFVATLGGGTQVAAPRTGSEAW